MIEIEYLQIALNISKLSHCVKNHVGCVIVIDNIIISNGYNYNLHGECDQQRLNCQHDCHGSCLFVLHAEHNAIMSAIKQGYDLSKAVLYSTLSPCLACARIIYSANISKVIYMNSYAEYKGLPYDEGVKFLNTLGIPTTKQNT
jgi:dCMP deaminase